MIRCSYVLHCECSLLVDFVDFATGQWTCGQTDRPTETRLAGWLADKQTDSGTGKHADRQIRTAVCFIGCHKISTSILFICLASTTTKYKEPLDCCWPAREREREKGSLDSWLKLCVCPGDGDGGRWIFLSACCFSVCGMQLLTMRPSCSSGIQQMLKFMQLQCQ